MGKLAFSFGAALLLSAAAMPAPSKLIDYAQGDHEISLAALRAGNHDDSGKNDYYFTAVIHTLVNDPEERTKPLTERKKLSTEPKLFGNVTLEALRYWGKEPEIKIAVLGDELRQLTAAAMKKFQIPEDKVTLLVELTMFEKAKKWWFFGEDFRVGSTSYELIETGAPRRFARKNRDLVITDKLGTEVIFKVIYDTPLVKTVAH